METTEKKTIKDTEKDTIKAALKEYCTQKGGTNLAAKILKVSSATISQINGGKYDSISDKMFLKIAKQIGCTFKGHVWNVVSTTVQIELEKYLTDAKEDAAVHAICAKQGSGKTETLKKFEAENENVFIIRCGDYHNRKTFLEDILHAMAKSSEGLTVNDMVKAVVKNIKEMQDPIIILDEVDKLSNQGLYFFITFFNLLEDVCALILIATKYFFEKMKIGVKNNKKGYREIESRYGGRIIELSENTNEDYARIMRANDVTDEKEIQRIADDCDGDIRRIKKLVRAYHRKLAEATAAA